MSTTGCINGHAAAVCPRWQPESRELYWEGELVKKLGHAAPMQQLILDAFTESGWPARIDDPLPRHSWIPAKQHLRDTLRNLNRGLARLRFRADNVGQGVRWEMIRTAAGDPAGGMEALTARGDSPPSLALGRQRNAD